MFICKKIQICFRIFDVLYRADCEYVPISVMERIYRGETSKAAYLDVLNILRKNGIVQSKRGYYGGYKQVRSVSLLELMRIFSPAKVPNPDDYGSERHLKSFVTKVQAALMKCRIDPQKAVPLEFCIDDDDVETASMDVHEPTDGHL